MSLESAHAELRAHSRELGQAVAELVTIVHEDRPHGSEVAVVDALTETVSELQSDAVGAAELVDRVREPRSLPIYLSRIDEAVAACATTYWRDLRAFEPLGELRLAARRGGHEWRSWQHSVEASQLRCEPLLQETTAAVRAAWGEIAELLGLYLPPNQTTTTSDSATAYVAGTSTRRPQ